MDKDKSLTYSLLQNTGITIPIDLFLIDEDAEAMTNEQIVDALQATLSIIGKKIDKDVLPTQAQ